MGFSLKPSDRKFKNTETIIEPLVETKLDNAHQPEPKFNPWDYIRVVNVRGEPEFQATSDEKVIIGHRGNPILGNKHIMQNKSMQERDRVIAGHKADLDADIAVKGPMWKLLQGIARDIMENKQKVAIECWCAPRGCHNDVVIPVVVQMVEEMLAEKEIDKNNKLGDKKACIEDGEKSLIDKRHRL